MKKYIIMMILVTVSFSANAESRAYCGELRAYTENAGVIPVGAEKYIFEKDMWVRMDPASVYNRRNHGGCWLQANNPNHAVVRDIETKKLLHAYACGNGITAARQPIVRKTTLPQRIDIQQPIPTKIVRQKMVQIFPTKGHEVLDSERRNYAIIGAVGTIIGAAIIYKGLASGSNNTGSNNTTRPGAGPGGTPPRNAPPGAPGGTPF